MMKRIAVLLVFLVAAVVAASPSVAGVIVAPADRGIGEPGVNDFALTAPSTGVSFSDLGAADSLAADPIGGFILPQEYQVAFAPQSDRGLGRPLRRGAGSASLPEPATLLLLGSGLTALAAGRRLRR